MSEKTKEKLREIILEKGQIKEQVDFSSQGLSLDKLNFDSVDFVELIVMIEDSFEIQFRDEDLILDSLTDYSELEKLVIRYIDEKEENNKCLVS